jgi:hypothetical protein
MKLIRIVQKRRKNEHNQYDHRKARCKDKCEDEAFSFVDSFDVSVHIC